MGKVRDILAEKGNIVYSVSPDTTVYDAIVLMCEKNIGGLLITENGAPAGIFTERDYARKLILKGKSSKDTAIREIMTSKLITVTPEDTLDQCMELMTSKHIRHLPVVSEGEIKGVISIGDVVRAVMKEQREIINHLEHYITGPAF